MKRRALVVANWKMNPGSAKEARRLFTASKHVLRKAPGVTLVIAPPFPYLSLVKKSGNVLIGAQNVSVYEGGAHTGEVSVSMLADMRVSHVIIGHSERRRMGEDFATINQKVFAALAAKREVILCIGEEVRDVHGDYLAFLKEEISSALSGVSLPLLRRVTIAYEPIWAIGKTATDAMKPSDVHEMVIFVRKTLAGLYAATAALSVPVLYGGSVEADNAQALMRDSEISGFLVGHASLVPEHMALILKAAAKR